MPVECRRAMSLESTTSPAGDPRCLSSFGLLIELIAESVGVGSVLTADTETRPTSDFNQKRLLRPGNVWRPLLFTKRTRTDSKLSHLDYWQKLNFSFDF